MIMTIHLSSWVFPLIVMVCIGFWAFTPRSGDYSRYGAGPIWRTAVFIFIALVVWLIWAIFRINFLSW